MSALFEENFELYGGDADKLLDGVWAQLNPEVTTGDIQLEIPEFEELGRYWLAVTGRGDGARGVFSGGAVAGLGWFQRVRFEELPAADNRAYVFGLLNSGATQIMRIKVTASGYITLHNSADEQIGITGTPVIVAGRTHKIQAQVVIHASTGTFELRLDNVVVMELTDLNLGSTSASGFVIAQSSTTSSLRGPFYVKDLAIYSLTGTYNASWPSIAGVATVLVNGTTATNNFTPRYRKMFGDGTFQLEESGDVLDCNSSTDYDLGTADYTLEGFFRFSEVPTGSTWATLLAKWSSGTSNRSYRLRLNGPSEEEGGLQFEYSTNGLIGTVVKLHDVNWAPVIGHQYHIAVVRESDVSSLYIDGVRQGLPVADTATYHPATANFTVGGEMDGTGTSVVADTSMVGFVDEIRITPGVARYSANFTPTTEAFPRSVGDGDASFANVALLCGFEEGVVDESDFAHVIEGRGWADRYLPQDGDAAYQAAGTRDPLDDRYLEASLVPATGVLTLTGLPLNTETVTLASTTYTFNTTLGGAGSVLIGATVAASLLNLTNAINGGDGEGTTYGTGTVPNASAGATAATPTVSDMTATATTPGTAGNSLASTETLTDGAWGAATLAGGTNLPGASLFEISNLPNTATGVRWVAARHRSDVDVGTATMKQDFLVNGDVAAGASRTVTSAGKTTYTDRFEEDPDTAAGLTVNSIVNGQLRIDRTA